MDYKTSVPIMNSNITKENRDVLLQQVLKGKIHRVVLSVNRCFLPHKLQDLKESLAENAAFFASQGIEVGVWLGCTLGHGVPLGHDEADENTPIFTDIVGINGELAEGAFCPLDENFAEGIARFAATVASSGVKFMLLDDDFRLSHRVYGIGCACHRHLAAISERLGRTVTREELYEKVFTGGPCPERDAWLAVQGESMIGIAKRLRAAVDEIDPDIRIGQCCSHVLWDVDGVDAVTIAKILAGKNKPFMRLLGAPYWPMYDGFTLPWVIETERMFYSHCPDDGSVEIVSEGDVYPRPRYNVPSSYLTVFDACLRADNRFDGILKYMFDYTSSPSYETGYVDSHIRALPMLEQVSAYSANAGEAVGVRVYEFLHKIEGARFNAYTGNQMHAIQDFSCSPAGNMLSRCSIPTTYKGDGVAGIVFGDNATYLDESAFNTGLILDAPAAKILTDRGLDVGLREAIEMRQSVRFEQFLDLGERAAVQECDGVYYNMTLADGAVVSSFRVDADGAEAPLSYVYENGNGQRFFVLGFDARTLHSFTNMFNTYGRQAQLMKYIPWLSGKALPAVCPKHPDLYILCKEKDGGLMVGLFNLFADEVYLPTVTLGDSYTGVDFMRGAGELSDNTLQLTESIPAFGFALFTLRK